MIRIALTAAMILIAVSGSAASSEVSYQGVVTGPGDEPAAGAEISIYVFTLDYERMTWEGRLLDSIEADERGQFEYMIDRSDFARRTAFIGCIARKAPLSVGFAFFGDEPAQVRLTESQTLCGHVQDSDGNAVSGADVRLYVLGVPGNRYARIYGIDPVPYFHASSDKQGRFEFGNLPEGCTAEIMATKEGLAPFFSVSEGGYRAGYTYAAGGDDAVVTMEEPITVRGVVRDAGGAPVSRVGVRMWRPAIFTNMIRSLAETGEDGTFEFSGLAPQSYMLDLVDSDWVGQTLMVEASGDMEVELQAGKGGVLTVAVVDSSTNEPLESAQVNINKEGPRHLPSPPFFSGEDGTVQRRLAGGSYGVYVYRKGYISQWMEVDIVEGQTAEAAISLQAMARLSGTVLDDDGMPVAGARVLILPGGSDVDVVTDSEGKFELRWNNEYWQKSEFYLVVMHNERNLAGIMPITGDCDEIELDLEGGQIITGRVVDPDGAPIALANINVGFHFSNWSTTMPGPNLNRTGVDGVYTITAIPHDGDYSIEVVGPAGYGTAERDISPEDGDTIEVADVVLRPANMSVSGRVVDEEGNALAGVSVQASGTDQPYLHVLTDADGKFVFDGVCEGPIRLYAWHEIDGEQRYADVDTEGGARDVTLVMGLSERARQYVPRRPSSLAGKSLDLSEHGIELADGPSTVLVCVWDWRQRPSRHMVEQLAAMGETLAARSVQVVLLHWGALDRGELEEWLAEFEVPFALGVVEEDSEEARFELGIQALPWLILADADGEVVADGFELAELSENLELIE